MKVAQIEIKNFRCFDDLTVDFDRNLNVIVGANGAGKTAFTDALANSLIAPPFSQFGMYHYNAGYYGSNYNPTRDLPVNSSGKYFSRNLNNRDVDLLFEVILKIVDFYKFENQECEVYNGEPMMPLLYGLDSDNQLVSCAGSTLNSSYFYSLKNHLTDINILNKNISLPFFAYYPSARRLSEAPSMGGNELFQMKFDMASGFGNCLNAGLNYQHLFQWLFLRQYQENNKKHRGEKLVDLISMRQAISEVIDNVKDVFFDETPPKLKIELNDGNIYDIEQLSDGYRNMLAIVMDYARRLALIYPQWDNPCEAPGILIIDEIELHLHPKWQQRVIPDLRRAFPNTQIIVTTHSPAVISTVKRENIIILGADHKQKHIDDGVGTYGAESSKILAEIFEVSDRPKTVETEKLVTEYLALIEKEQHDSEPAKSLRSKLEEYLGHDDGLFLEADLRIKYLKFIKEKAK
ncbi:MAG: AAA family ATPase [Candidatus Symbiobacter sp.]|nr:AAA family ATPase [Candidatus Symbiobacter sp.]